MKRTILPWWTTLFVLIVLSSCSTKIRFNTQKPSDPRFGAIRSVGVNTVLLMDSQALNLKDDLGRWRLNKGANKAKKGLDTLVRKSLVANLKRFSDYEVIDLHDLRRLQQTFQKLRPLSGERIGELDLMIDVRIAYYSQQQQGSTQELMTFRREKSVVKEDKWVKVEDSSKQRVVSVPYSHSRVDIACYVEVIKTRNGEAKVLKSFNTSLTNTANPMTSVQAMANEMAIAIAGRILKDVSTYSVITTRKIDKASDDEVIGLMEQANLNAAATKLEKILTRSKKRKPADVYNLGICYEAFGDPALALQMYREAHTLDSDNELYIKAIGELE